MNKEVLLTQESYHKLKEELEYLTTTKRVQITNNLKSAVEHGDLRENAEFEAEKDRQNVMEVRINDITRILKNCRIVEVDYKKNKIGIGKNIILYDIEFNETLEYKIVDSVEADPLNGKISYNSPVGKALMGKKENDLVEVDLPMGKIIYRVDKIF